MRHKHHAGIGPRFTGFTGALHAIGDFLHLSAILFFFETESTTMALLE